MLGLQPKGHAAGLDGKDPLLAPLLVFLGADPDAGSRRRPEIQGEGDRVGVLLGGEIHLRGRIEPAVLAGPGRGSDAVAAGEIPLRQQLLPTVQPEKARLEGGCFHTFAVQIARIGIGGELPCVRPGFKIRAGVGPGQHDAPFPVHIQPRPGQVGQQLQRLGVGYHRHRQLHIAQQAVHLVCLRSRILQNFPGRLPDPVLFGVKLPLFILGISQGRQGILGFEGGFHPFGVPAGQLPAPGGDALLAACRRYQVFHLHLVALAQKIHQGILSVYIKTSVAVVQHKGQAAGGKAERDRAFLVFFGDAQDLLMRKGIAQAELHPGNPRTAGGILAGQHLQPHLVDLLHGQFQAAGGLQVGGGVFLLRDPLPIPPARHPQPAGDILFQLPEGHREARQIVGRAEHDSKADARRECAIRPGYALADPALGLQRRRLPGQQDLGTVQPEKARLKGGIFPFGAPLQHRLQAGIKNPGRGQKIPVVQGGGVKDTDIHPRPRFALPDGLAHGFAVAV